MKGKTSHTYYRIKTYLESKKNTYALEKHTHYIKK